MSQTIDSKSERHSYRVLFMEETITTTLTLVYSGSKTSYDIYYDAVFSGIKSGKVNGGPIPVSGNLTKEVNHNPEVIVKVSQFNNDIANNYVSMHITITVDIPVIGKKTIFDQVIGGDYNPDVNGWELILSEFQTEIGSLIN